MFVPTVETWDNLRCVNFLKDINESTVVLFQNRIFGGHVQWHTAAQRHLETRVCKPTDRLLMGYEKDSYDLV